MILARKLTSAIFHLKASAGLGALPNVLGIGGMKCGTTSLYHYLTQHPQVGGSRAKELHYFDEQFAKPIRWYRANFPRRASFVRLECTANYLHHPQAPRRAASVVPDAKLIVFLRDPVDRAYSHYHHSVRAGLEPLRFDDALEEEAHGLSQQSAKRGEEAEPSYLSRGHYSDALDRWRGHFPRDRMLILRSEDLFADPRRTLGIIFDFLALPGHDCTDLARKNSGHYPPMPAATRRRLEQLFEAPNRALKEHYGIAWA